MQKNQKIILVILTIALVLIIATLAWRGNKRTPQTSSNQSAQSADINAAIPNYPEEILLDSQTNAKKTLSVVSNQPGQYTIMYSTPLAPKDVAQLYQDYFKANNFILKNISNANTGLLTFAAVKDNLTVTLQASKVSVSAPTAVSIYYIKK